MVESEKMDEIRDYGDAQRISRMVLESARGKSASFNPYEGSVLVYPDGTIRFMGEELDPREALTRIADRLWKERMRVNRQIRKRNLLGSDFVNCGC